MLRKSSFELNKLLVFNVFTDVYNHQQYLNSDSVLKYMKYHSMSSLIDLPLVSSFVKWIMFPLPPLLLFPLLLPFLLCCLLLYPLFHFLFSTPCLLFLRQGLCRPHYPGTLEDYPASAS